MSAALVSKYPHAVDDVPCGQSSLCMFQLTYHPMDRDEMRMIGKAQKEGNLDILYQHPSLRNIARQGVICIKLISVEGLTASSWWRGAHKYV